MGCLKRLPLNAKPSYETSPYPPPRSQQMAFVLYGYLERKIRSHKYIAVSQSLAYSVQPEFSLTTFQSHKTDIIQAYCCVLASYRLIQANTALYLPSCELKPVFCHYAPHLRVIDGLPVFCPDILSFPVLHNTCDINEVRAALGPHFRALLRSSIRCVFSSVTENEFLLHTATYD